MAHTNLAKANNSLLASAEVNELLYVSSDGDAALGSATVATDFRFLVRSDRAVDGILIDNTKADGDPILGFQLSGVSKFTMGVDDGDSDKFKIGTTAIGTNTRVIIDGSGNVGIGDDAPTNKLAVTNSQAGALTDVLALRNSSNTSGAAAGLIILASNDQGAARIYSETAAADGTYNLYIATQQATGDIVFKTGSTGADERMRLTLAGNVGIGTAIPSTKMHVAGNIALGSGAPATFETYTGFDGIVRIGDRGVAANYQNTGLMIGSNFYFDGDYKRIETGYATRVTFHGGGFAVNVSGTAAADSIMSEIEALTVTSTGNVGIGTASPDDNLVVASAGTNEQTKIKIETYNDQGGYSSDLILTKSHSDILGTLVDTIDTEILGRLIFNGVDNTQAIDWGAHIDAVQNGAAGVQIPTDLHFYTSNGTGIYNRVTIGNDGNVGIGTAIPSTKMHVAGNIALGSGAPATFETYTGFDGIVRIGDRGVAANYHNTGLMIGSNFYFDGDYKRIETGYATRVTFHGGGFAVNVSGTAAADSIMSEIEALTVTSTGNVGIGTASPQKMLHVLNSATTSQTANINSLLVLESTGVNLLEFMATAGYTGQHGMIFSDDVNSRSYILYRHSTDTLSIGVAGTDAITIDSSKNVLLSVLTGGAVNVTADASGNLIRDPSDAMFKENDKAITGAMDLVNKLQGKSFEWKSDCMMGGRDIEDEETKEKFWTANVKADRSAFGFIAQEVEKEIPSLISAGAEYKSIKDKEIIAIHNEALKELQAENKELREDLERLKAA